MRLPLTFWGFLFMKFLEKDLEQIIFESGRDSLREKGLPIYGKLFRQLKIGNYGIADLVSFTRPRYQGSKRDYFVPGEISIYELKKDQIGISAFLQALTYAKGIQRYLEVKGYEDKYILNIVIIGKELDKSGSFCFIPDMLAMKNQNFCSIEQGMISFYTYDYKIDGLVFTEELGYTIKNEGF
jgi:hypothetical protein